MHTLSTMKFTRNYLGISFFIGVVVLTSKYVLPNLWWLTGAQQPIAISSLTGQFDATENSGTFHGAVVTPKDTSSFSLSQVLGDRVTDEQVEKRIEVDLTNQRLYAYENGAKVYDFLISSGKWGRTPTGTFRIWGKFRYTKMSGGSKALNTYYYLPNVPYVMFFSNDTVAASRGFSLHGTYWHSNFGQPMSHGCVNMKTEEAGIIYNWSLPDAGDKRSVKSTEDSLGTEIVIYGTPPKS